MGYTLDLKHKERVTSDRFVTEKMACGWDKDFGGEEHKSVEILKEDEIAIHVEKNVDVEMINCDSSNDFEKIAAGTGDDMMRNGRPNPGSPVFQHSLATNNTSPSSNSTTQPPSLTNLPPELHNNIFELLGPVASTCVDITCHRLYAIHRSYYNHVSLYRHVIDVNGRSHQLIHLLRKWMKPAWLVGIRPVSGKPLPCFVHVGDWGEWNADKVMADYAAWCEKNLAGREA